MLPANDLGFPTRMVLIARSLADLGNEVAVFNPAPAPGKLIAEAGLTTMSMPARPMPAPAFDLMQLSEAWEVEHFLAAFIRARSTCAKSFRCIANWCATTTITERESNARRVAWLGAGEVVMPVNGADDEKSIDVAEFRVRRDGNARTERAALSSIRAQAAAEQIEQFIFAQ
jgi:hypothetical protein